MGSALRSRARARRATLQPAAIRIAPEAEEREGPGTERRADVVSNVVDAEDLMVNEALDEIERAQPASIHPTSSQRDHSPSLTRVRLDSTNIPVTVRIKVAR